MRSGKVRNAIVAAFMLLLIIGSAVMVKQSPFKTLPLCVSVFVSLLSMKINRYAFLVGGINSIIYTFVFISMGIYATALSTFLTSFPIQIITFISWQRRAYKNSVVLRSLSRKMWIIMVSAFVALWSAVFFTLYLKGNPFAILDTTSTLLGLVTTFLSLLAFKEYSYIGIISGVVSVAMNVQLSMSDITNSPYLIYSVYSLVCTVFAVINTNKLYKEQREVEVKQ